jgi:hypothetical protein
MKQVEAANAALMERTPFAIDDAKDDEDDSDVDSGAGAGDDAVMDEVGFHVQTPTVLPLTNLNRWMLSWRRMIRV